MRNTWAVCCREFSAFFVTPVGYIVTGVFALISGLAFALSLFTYAKMSVDPTSYGFSTVPDFAETFLSPYLVFTGIWIMFLSPLITMRLLAEERHRGTMELLLTWPLRDREIIFGKYLAALGILLVLMLIVAVHLVVVSRFVALEPAVIVFGVCTVWLMGMSFLAIGLFVSALSRSQITAGIVTFGGFLLLYILGNVGEKLPAVNPAPAAWPETVRMVFGGGYALFRGLVMELALDNHARDMALGVVSPPDIAYYLLVSAFFLFLTFRALESRNWRGK